MTPHRFWRAWLLASTAALPLAAQAEAAAPTAVTVLLGQAAYWRAHGQPGQAGEALRRVLRIDPSNADALAQQAQDAADDGNPAAARLAIAKLSLAQPADPRAAQLEQTLQQGAPDPAALAQARGLAQAGKPAEAIAAYRKLFNGDTPPPALATEYYQTLAATRDGQAPAQAGLAATVRASPDDLHAQLAYAQLLTYREGTRAAGIGRLQALTRYPEVAQPARDAWRQALLWAGNNPQMLGPIETYLQHEPGDTEVAERRASLLAAQPDAAAKLRTAGYQAMQARRRAEAERDFDAALAQNPNDADSLAMLSILSREQGRGAEADRLLDRAAEAAPERRDELLAAARPARAPDTGASRAAYARVNQLADRGDYRAAEAALGRLMARRPSAGSLVQLGYIQLRSGDANAAEASFRRALAERPHDRTAEAGLASVMARQGNTDAALALYAQAGDAAGLRGLQQARSDALRDQARHAQSTDEKLRLYRLAVAAGPADPWLRLEAARALLGAAQRDEARAVMAPVLNDRHPSSDAARAGLYYADSAGDDALALSLAARLPPRDRTPELAAIARRAEVGQDLRSARSEPTLADMRGRMLELAETPDPSGARVAAFAQELIQDGDKTGARSVIRAALAAQPMPTAAQRIAYADALVAAGFPRDAQIVTAALPAVGLNPLQRSTLQTVQVSAAVERSDQLNTEGEAADAYDQLAPGLAQDPHNPDLNMALARLYQAKQRPQTALQIDEGVLKDNPDDLDAHVAAISAAMSAGELGHASGLAAETKRLFPDEPGAWLAAAQVARARGDNGDALANLHTARALRAQQLSGRANVSGALEDRLRLVRYASYQPLGSANDANLLPPAVPGEPVTRAYEQVAQAAPVPVAPSGRHPQVNTHLNALINPPSVALPAGTRPVETEQDGVERAGVQQAGVQQAGVQQAGVQQAGVQQAGAGVPHNPFRTPALPDEPDSLPSLTGEVRAKPPPDPVMAEIDRTLNQVSTDVAPEASASLSLRGRSGPSGLASLFDLSAPLEGRYSPYGYGRLRVAVTPEFLDAGSTSRSNLINFGTNALGPAGSLLRRGASSATGVGLDTGYSYEFASADVGVTPLGFPRTSVVGGVELAPQVATDLTLRATLDRRAVTDSLLSYAGEKDPRTGAIWGGVTRDHAHLQLEGAAGDIYYYAGIGGGLLTGQNVRDNTEVDAGAGFSVPLWQMAGRELRTGVDLVYFSYNRNLQNFTFGSGGYFSPQSFIAGLIPLTYSQTVSPDLKFSVGGAVGVQSFSEEGTPVFQTSALQQSLAALAAIQPGTTTTVAATHTTGLAGGAHGEIDYRVTENLHIGAKAGFDRSGNFTEGTGLIYARYVFSGERWSGPPDGGPDWRLFLRALAEEVDSLTGPDERDDLLRGAGRRLSLLMPLPDVATLEALQIEMNDALAAAGWGAVILAVDEADPAVTLVHTGLPRIGSMGTPPGQWLAGMLPGLYDGWLSQQPGSQASLHTHRVGAPGPEVTMRYSLGAPAAGAKGPHPDPLP